MNVKDFWFMKVEKLIIPSFFLKYLLSLLASFGVCPSYRAS